jgi:RNA recognition motif-containing protein
LDVAIIITTTGTLIQSKMSKLFVYGVDEYTENHDIQSEFSKYGTVTDVYNTGKGYAFVTFDRDEDAKTAIQEMDGQTVFGKQIKVNAARPKEGGGGGRGGGGYGGGGRGGYGGEGVSFF